jgi:hypothetical protein
VLASSIFFDLVDKLLSRTSPSDLLFSHRELPLAGAGLLLLRADELFHDFANYIDSTLHPR